MGEISWAGYCGVCGVELMKTAVAELHYHRGPTFDKWRRGMAASVGATLDDTRESA